VSPAGSGGGSLRADVLSAYVLTACRLAAWAGVSAVAYRASGPEAFALLALLRGTITLVGYAAVGLGPAMVRLLAEAADPVEAVPAAPTTPDSTGVLSYAGPSTELLSGDDGRPAVAAPPPTPQQQVYRAGVAVAQNGLAWVAIAATVAYALNVAAVHVVPYPLRDAATNMVFCFGLGVFVRLCTEPASAALQVRGRLAVDNLILAGGDLLWLALAAAVAADHAGRGGPLDVALFALNWAIASAVVGAARTVAVRFVAPDLHAVRSGVPASPAIVARLVRFGSAMLVAQLADFLYAPTDYILINRFLSPLDLAAYAPAVQVDAALLLVVAGVSAALFPRAAVAHAAGDLARLRRMYVLGTLATGGVLVAAAAVAWGLSPWLFRLWLGDEPTGTRAVLPLVLVHTVVGGSSAVGRSVLLGMGRVRALTVSALVAGGANVVLSAALATAGGLGLKGIVLGTVAVVVARCAVWMPWYVLRTLREDERTRADGAAG
jgi:O-antigen/teichoic acid export membrane protein